MKNLSGKNAVLTGGSSGIGPHIARALAIEGVNVAIAARTSGLLESVAQDLSNLGTRVIAIPTDITIDSERIKLLKQVKEEFGQIDFLINNAAIGHLALFAHQDEKKISRNVETNITAPIILSRKL